MKPSLKIAATFSAALIMIAILWWSRLSGIERWLILNRQAVEANVAALLDGGLPETPVALLDATLVVDGDVAVISFHDDHSRALVFAPSTEGRDRFLMDNPPLILRKLSRGWFEAIINDE